MNILVVGINYRSAPLELRESLSFNPTQAAALMSGMRTLPGVEGCVLLSTCNRTELYLHASQVELDPQVVIAGLCERRGLDLPTVKKHFHIYLGIGAVQHLFRVACGLDSMLLGENQILGQVRDAHAVALAAGHSGTVLNVLFRHALTLAKDVKTRTGIARSRLSGCRRW